MTPAEERRLLERARAGDRKALDRLAETLSGPAYRFGRNFCRDSHDAEDVMQDVLTSLARGFNEFRGGASLSTWAYVVARNACLKMRRRRMNQPEILESIDAPNREGGSARDIPHHDQDPHAEVEKGELREALEKAILALPPAQREVLVLRDVEGLPAAEVGRILQLGERTVKSRLHRARLALRAALAPHFGDGGAAAAGSSGLPRRRKSVTGLPARPSMPAGLPVRSSTPTGPTCPDTALLLSRYLERELDASVCRELEGHVAGCPRCGAACKSLRASLALCRGWGGDRAPESIQRAVREALRRTLAEAVGGGKHGPRLRPARRREGQTGG